MLAKDSGFQCTFLGAAVSMWEMHLLPRRFEAIMAEALPAEHRVFLQSLEFDKGGFPMVNGHYAGVDACFLLRKEA